MYGWVLQTGCPDELLSIYKFTHAKESYGPDTLPLEHTEVQDWLEYNKDKTIMINDGIMCGTAKCLEEHDLKASRFFGT